MNPPLSEQELLERCTSLLSKTLGDIAEQFMQNVPEDFLREKGWVGQLMEQALGCSAGTKAEPDFLEIGVELKTLPLNAAQKPKESTFVCAVPKKIALYWHESVVWKKLNRVLWLPIEADKNIPIAKRRIGQAILWSPTAKQEAILQQDWHELTEMLTLGQYDQLTAKHGTYLQCRPKAANAKVLRENINAEGEAEWIIPRGFYLRPSFTKMILHT